MVQNERMCRLFSLHSRIVHAAKNKLGEEQADDVLGAFTPARESSPLLAGTAPTNGTLIAELYRYAQQQNRLLRNLTRNKSFAVDPFFIFEYDSAHVYAVGLDSRNFQIEKNHPEIYLIKSTVDLQNLFQRYTNKLSEIKKIRLCCFG